MEGSVSKMGNKQSGGFDSKREHRRYQDLLLLEKIGEIRNLKTQVVYELTPKAGKERASTYRADFTYEEKTTIGSVILWVPIVEDCKGFRTIHYILKRKFLRYRYGIQIRET
jgi:hypothetical protein